ncbi:MAG: metallophosphoesterase [Gammaproteobacteria bacterium]|nr:metallophosphoesterase [Gammaproteobacteria bacterium]
MKIQIASDLHLEFDGGSNARRLSPVDRDLLVLAGDISVGRGALSFISEQLQISEVVYVPGNHEYYGGHRRKQLDAWWREVATRELHGLHYLPLDETEINGVRIKGATWYSDFWGGDGRFAELGVSDFRPPFNQPDDWGVLDHKSAHEVATSWLQIGERANVVVTHFPPSLHAISKHFRDPTNPASLLNSYFINDKEDLVRELSPEVWISGHTHVPYDYMIGDCRCVANPCGYPGESDRFESAKIVEV